MSAEQKWTPEPWKVERPEDEFLKTAIHFIGERPTITIWADGSHGFYHEIALVAEDQNARRIVACVNKLAGFTEAEIEAGTFEVADESPWGSRSLDLLREAQRRGLRLAEKAIRKYLKHSGGVSAKAKAALKGISCPK